MNILIPLNPGNQFILLNIGHALLVDKEKEKYTKRNGNSTEQNTERFMTEYPVHPRIIKTI